MDKHMEKHIAELSSMGFSLAKALPPPVSCNKGPKWEAEREVGKEGQGRAG